MSKRYSLGQCHTAGDYHRWQSQTSRRSHHQLASMTISAMYDDHQNSKASKWDSEVVAGVMDRLDSPFRWIDIHWRLEKAELLPQVKEWNTALEQYCNDEGLSGPERAAVVAKHTASPFAPCANPACSNVEKKVKECKRCSTCKSVAYVSDQ